VSSQRKYDVKRGRHKKRTSKEEQEWNRNHLIPEKPPWMNPATYVKLARLRGEL